MNNNSYIRWWILLLEPILEGKKESNAVPFFFFKGYAKLVEDAPSEGCCIVDPLKDPPMYTFSLHGLRVEVSIV